MNGEGGVELKIFKAKRRHGRECVGRAGPFWGVGVSLWLSAAAGFLGGSVVTNPPAKQETQVRSLDQKDPLEKELAIYSCILAWRIPWTEEPGRLQSMRLQRVGHN